MVVGPYLETIAAGQVGYHLVDVHVARGARTGLEHVHRELVVVLAVDDLLSRRDDGFGSLAVEQAQFTVDLGSGQFDAGDGMDEASRHRLARHRKILHRTLGLGAIERRDRHPQLTHAVSFDTMIAHVTPSLDDRSLHHGAGNRGLQAIQTVRGTR